MAATPAPLLTRADVEQMLAETARTEGLEMPEVRWDDVPTCSARLKQGRAVITLGEGLLADPERIRFSALHELGHVAHGDMLPRRALPIVLGLLAAPPGSALIAALVASVAGADADTIGLSAALALLPGIALMHVSLVLLAWPREYAADDFAARHGADMTPRIAAQLERSGPPRWVAWLLSTHPAPAARLRWAERQRGRGHSSARSD